MHRKKISPIVLRETPKWMEANKRKESDHHNVTNTEDLFRIHLNTEENLRVARRIVQQKNVEYYIYALEDKKKQQQL